MSVLYKALQKAQKENEERQPVASAAPAGASTGAMRLAMPSVNWRVAGLGAAVLLAAVIGVAFFLFETSAPAPAPQVARTAPAPAMQPPAQPATPPAAPATPDTAAAPVAAPASDTAPAPTQVAQAPAAPAEEPATAPEASQPVALTPKVEAKPAAPKAAPSAPVNTQMPQLAADSPARVLNPPINIKRDEYDFSGVGDSVQVRRVSQQAQDNVTAGYNALVRGDHEMALGFYERALQQEPRSVLAQLGRGAAQQKLGNSAEARAAYERVLKIDPSNREALTNLTSIVAEREPGEALRRLQDLEKEYPSFSPVKASIGLVYARMGSFEPALDYLRRAVNLTPDAPMYHYNLALVLDRLERKEQAVASYERVLAAAALGRIAPEIVVADIERRVRYLRSK
jgi:Tfp pilus assembly protein PilF